MAGTDTKPSFQTFSVVQRSSLGARAPDRRHFTALSRRGKRSQPAHDLPGGSSVDSWGAQGEQYLLEIVDQGMWLDGATKR
jgi:hypothetical protein